MELLTEFGGRVWNVQTQDIHFVVAYQIANQQHDFGTIPIAENIRSAIKAPGMNEPQPNNDDVHRSRLADIVDKILDFRR